MFRGGVRLDWDISKYDKITLQGDVYVGEEGDTVPVPILTPPFSQNVTGDSSVSGGNFLSRWSHEFSDTSNLSSVVLRSNQSGARRDT
jgi:hypothetical protein